MKSCVIGRGGATFSRAMLIAPASALPTQMGAFMPIFVAHDDVGIIIGVEHQPFQMHLGNHGKRCPKKLEVHRNELCTLSFISACQRSWRDRKRKSVRRQPESTRRNEGRVRVRAIVLIKLGSVRLLAVEFQERLHLLSDQFTTALISQVDLVFIDDHDPHRFPFFQRLCRPWI